MAQIPPIEDNYIDDVIKSNIPHNPSLNRTQGNKMRELVKLLRDRLEQEISENYQSTTIALESKVDKEAGKGLSQEDFTSAFKSKLEELALMGVSSGPVDTIGTPITENSPRLFYNTTSYKLRVYNPVSGQWRDAIEADLTNYYTKTEVDALINAIPTPDYPVTSVNGKIGDVVINKDDVGLTQVDNTSDLNKPISNSTQVALNNKVDKENGKGLSQENFTSAYKSKLEELALMGIPAGPADNTTTPITANSPKLFFNTTSNKLRVYDPILSTWRDANETDLSNYYTKSEVNALINAIPTPDYPVTSVNGKTGDVAISKDDLGLGAVENTSDLDKPISNSTQVALDNKVDKENGKGLSQENFTSVYKSKLEELALMGIPAGPADNTTTPITANSPKLFFNTTSNKLRVYDPISSTWRDANETDLSNYYTKSEVNALINAIPTPDYPVTSVNGKIGDVAISKEDLGLGAVENTSDLNKPISTATAIALASKINTGEKGAANGIATLDSTMKIPLSQVPDALIGSVNYQGNWNPGSNTPTLPTVPDSSTKGHYYIVSVAGNWNGNSFENGDWIISNGNEWGKVDNNNKVVSVNGKQGAVVLGIGDISGLQTFLDGKANTDGTNATGTWSISITGNSATVAGKSTSVESSGDTLALRSPEGYLKANYISLQQTRDNPSSGSSILNLVGFQTAGGTNDPYLYSFPKNLVQQYLGIPIEGFDINSFVKITSDQIIAGLKSFVDGIAILNYGSSSSGINFVGGGKIYSAPTNRLVITTPDRLYLEGTNGGVQIDGATSITSLAGAGIRMVTAGPNGILSTSALPSGSDGLQQILARGNEAENDITLTNASKDNRISIAVSATGNGVVIQGGNKNYTVTKNLLLQPGGAYVGIGTESPMAPLHVNGNIHIDGAISGQRSVMYTNNEKWIDFGSSTNRRFLLGSDGGATGDDYFRLYTYKNDGSYNGTPITVSRIDNQVGFGAQINVNGHGNSAQWNTAYHDRVDLTTLNQAIPVKKRFTYNGSNNYSGAPLEVTGNGSSLYPGIGFHQPGIVGSFVHVRNDGRLWQDDNMVHLSDPTGSISNGSDARINKSWFDYSWAGIGIAGSVINFSGLNGNYATELFGAYAGGNEFYLRTRNGDANSWKSPKRIWTNGDFSINEAAAGSSVVKRTGEGYINATYFNMSGPGVDGTAINDIVTTNGDGYLRRSSAATVKAWLNIGTGYVDLTSDQTIGGVKTFTQTIHSQQDIIAYSTSDERLKKNITSIENSLEKVKELGGYEFTWEEGQARTGDDYGVIAQEVEEVFPHAVITREDGYKAVDYQKLVPVLIEAIKELTKKVEDLENGISR